MKCVLLVVIRKMGPSPILSVIHTVTVGTMVNFNGSDNGYGV